MLLLLTGGLFAFLPKILLGILIVVVFLAVLFWILQKLPAPLSEWVWWIVIAVGGIILLLILIYVAQNGVDKVFG